MKHRRRLHVRGLFRWSSRDSGAIFSGTPATNPTMDTRRQEGGVSFGRRGRECGCAFSLAGGTGPQRELNARSDRISLHA